VQKASKINQHGKLVRFPDSLLHLRVDEKANRQTMLMLWDGNRQIQEYTTDHVFTTVYEQDSFVPVARLVWLQPHLQEQAKIAEDKQWQELENYVIPKYQKQRLEHQSQTGIRIYHYHNDHLGTPQELTNDRGDVVWLNYSLAWGGSFDKLNNVHNLDGLDVSADELQPIRFQGQFFDGETNLHYNRFRYYDSDVGMFVSRDPIGLDGGYNNFQYVANPTGWIDPYGLAKKNGQKRAIPTDCKCEEIDPCAENQNVSWSNHGNKHVPSSSLEWKKIVKDTGGGKAAKYKHGINIEALEKQAWEHGIKVSTPAGKNVVYKIFQVDHIIGASDGKETNMMRVECSQGVIHGHPITPANFQKLLKR
jgi:RHS repeat-associated protein